MRRLGRPVLVGTTSVESTEAFSEKLDELQVPHRVLNAKAEAAEREAEIIAQARPPSLAPRLSPPIFARELSRHTLHPALTVQAGRPASVTISTNMAGRGTDILLAVTRDTWPGCCCARLGAAFGVAVPAVDNLYPCGLSKAQTELIDAAVSAFVAEQAASDAEVAPASLEAIDETLAVAASAAVVYEGSAVDALREAYEAVKAAFDEALEPERQAVIDAGGLHVIGTNLHDSRRVDVQLRGRCGRQGDPGSTHFFLSLEDRIFRLFGGDKVRRRPRVAIAPPATARRRSRPRPPRRSRECSASCASGRRRRSSPTRWRASSRRRRRVPSATTTSFAKSLRLRRGVRLHPSRAPALGP